MLSHLMVLLSQSELASISIEKPQPISTDIFLAHPSYVYISSITSTALNESQHHIPAHQCVVYGVISVNNTRRDHSSPLDVGPAVFYFHQPRCPGDAVLRLDTEVMNLPITEVD